MPDASPFAALSLIVAPAILTNASSVLAMSTSNRLARAVDRARELARQLESEKGSDAIRARRLRDMSVAQDRTVLLMRALRSFYSALGGFAVATLLSLIGAVLTRTGTGTSLRVLEGIALGAGALAVAAIVFGSTLLLRETGLAVRVLGERAQQVRDAAAARDR
jgi:hypothetical protein